MIAVCFMDRVGTAGWAPRHAELPYLPEVFVRLEPKGLEGYRRRTWKLEQQKTGPVYVEQKPTRWETLTGKAKGRVVEEDT